MACKRSRLALLLLLALAGCTKSAPDATVSREEAVEAAAGADGPVYWAGELVGDLPLTSVTRGPDEVSFGYGTCDIDFPADGGCAAPVSVQNIPFRPDDWRQASACRTLTPVRGVPAVRHDGLVLLTRDGVVKIYARDATEEQRVIDALAVVGSDGPSRLPPPPHATIRLVERACD